MSASIAHEVNQPLTAIMVNGDAGLRWLIRDVPNLREVRDALKRIAGEANRASEVMLRISRALPEGEPAYGSSQYQQRHRRGADLDKARSAQPPRDVARRACAGPARCEVNGFSCSR